jgi:hypothetical protein
MLSRPIIGFFEKEFTDENDLKKNEDGEELRTLLRTIKDLLL